MANITEEAKWENDIYEFSLTDDIIGGPDGVDNLPHKQLANRSLYLKARIMSVGALIIWPTATPPAGYLECDGAALSRTTYAALYAVLGTTYGKGAGTAASTTFRLPDLRGEFIRGWDHGRGVDPDRAARTNRGDGTTGDNVGTKQTQATKSHRHLAGIGANWGSRYHDYATQAGSLGTGRAGTQRISVGYTGGSGGSAVTSASGGNETRPRNIALMYAIKY